jgi:hypothetical protein
VSPVVAVLAALGVVVSGCAAGPTGSPVSAGSSSSAPATVVPWVDQSAPKYVPAPTPAPTRAYPDCRASQLRGRAGRGGPAAGTVYQEIRLTDHSRRPCTLSGGPAAIVGVRSAGERVDLTTSLDTAVGANLVGPGPANLRPGTDGWLTLSHADECDAAMKGETNVFTSLRIRLDRGGTVRVNFPAPLNVICGLYSSPFGAPEPLPQDTSRWNPLLATAHLPATLVAGSLLRYTVTLRNRSPHNLVLSPCPSYAEYLSPVQGPEPGIVQRYYLDCHIAPDIAAGASVTMAMQIRVPEATGPTKYLWELQASNVTSGGVTTIEPAR